MKILAVILFSLVTLLQSFSKWVIMADYEFNKEYISKNLCINKKRPKLHCNGKCQLMKKLAEEEKQNAPGNNSQGTIKFQDIVYLDTFLEYSPTTYPQVQPLFHNYVVARFYESPISSIFHPPSRA
jgi:hypothetical protein